MLELNFPEFDIKLKREGDKTFVFDPIRKKHLVLTPEEWVRQHTINYLINNKQIPASLLAIEKGHMLNGLQKRSDVMAYNNSGKPILIVECKAPEVKITEKVFSQIANYNMVFKVGYLMVTNGLQHYYCKIDWEAREYQFLHDLPTYDGMNGN